MKGNLFLHFSARLTRPEEISLNILWALVFGPDATGEGSYFFFGTCVRYKDGEHSVLAKMKEVLETKAWEKPDFIEGGKMPAPGIIKDMESISWFGRFLDNLRSLHGKLNRIEAS